MGFSRQEYWSMLPFPSPRIKPTSLMSAALVGGFFTTSPTWEAPLWVCGCELLCRVQRFADPWTGARQAPLVHGILQARIMEWVTIPFSKESSQPRDRTQAFCIAGGFLNTWATMQALLERAKSKTLTATNASEKVEWWNWHTLQVGMQDDTTTLEDSLENTYKTACTLTMWSSDHAPWYLPKGIKNLCLHKNLNMGAYSSFIHNCQNLGATKMSFSRWTDKLWYIQTME